MTLVLRYAARSDRGLVRSNNQDSVYAGPRLLSLADGMGGHAAGEVASKVVIAALAPLDDDEPSEDLLSQLRDATQAGNSAIAELVASDPELDGMGTTLTAILFGGTRIGLVHIGDSRAYLRRNGTFAQITHDDTFVQSLIDEGRITDDEAATHPQRSLLLKALTGHEIEPNLTVREARPGDRYLLCSDGLSGVVTHETLSEAIQIPDPQACADRMIELALKGGGPDNVTVIIADVVDVDFGEDAPIVGGAAGNSADEQPPPDSPAARAGAITAPRIQPVRVDPPEEPPDPRIKRRKRIRLVVILLVLGMLVAAGAVAGIIAVNRQYFVGEGENGEIAIFQGVRGSILGISLNSQVEGSCDPGAVCDKRYVEDLQAAGQDSVRSGTESFESIREAREFIQELRSRYGLPSCDEYTRRQEGSATTAPSTLPAPTGVPTQASTPAGDPSTTAMLPPGKSEPIPGFNCRKRHDGDKGGG
ncbi:PP2C family protein-serine/threonine phosphatase [Actinophytocola sp.]|uniref:PP2C family protein-serine/threonine phosphatase n=1 Tax=Actinophytocola sp. TaxID=1872138 RepID=UPI002D7E966E|nr:protein phosphatase 2C domain-containing protein [Actinophytocola sp.]HET9144343.1 protein phosphatase 2C domain-containing protein [Actinophytocola sp.]